jgi:hypothetical protein
MEVSGQLHAPAALPPGTIELNEFYILYYVYIFLMTNLSFIRLQAGRWGSGIRFQAGAWNFSHHRVQNGPGAHPAFYPMGARGSFPGGKAVGAWSLTTQLHLVPRSKNEWKYTSTPQMPSWRGTQLKKNSQGQLYLYRGCIRPMRAEITFNVELTPPPPLFSTVPDVIKLCTVSQI